MNRKMNNRLYLYTRRFSLFTHNCGQLDISNQGQKVELSGWITNIRSVSKKWSFITLEDHNGATQVIVDSAKIDFKNEVGYHLESIIKVSGTVFKRIAGQDNPNMSTGQIEVLADNIELLNSCEWKILPFSTFTKSFSTNIPGEDLRLKYRFLDLRRASMHKLLVNRSKITQFIREYLCSRNFLEIETPLLFKSTPEGAKEFIVAKEQDGKLIPIYALPQSPQQFKQLLIASGIERYFQIAKCFRDESGRSDRQPEFTQIDIEMAFSTSQDVMIAIEGMIKAVWKEFCQFKHDDPFPILTFTQAINKYGSDKPDLRFPELEIVQTNNPNESIITEQLAFTMNETIRNQFLGHDITEELESIHISKDNTVIFIAKRPNIICHDGITSLGKLRNRLVSYLLNLPMYESRKNQMKFSWIIEFPLFKPIFCETNQYYQSMHHPFTAPLKRDLDYIEKNPLKASIIFIYAFNNFLGIWTAL